MHTNAYYLCRWFHPKTEVVSQFCNTSNIFLKEEVQIYVFSSTFGSQIMTLIHLHGPKPSTSTSTMSRDQSRHPHIQWSAASHRDEHWSLLNLFCSSLSEGMELPEVFCHMSAASWISRDGDFSRLIRSVCITSKGNDFCSNCQKWQIVFLGSTGSISINYIRPP